MLYRVSPHTQLANDQTLELDVLWKSESFKFSLVQGSLKTGEPLT